MSDIIDLLERIGRDGQLQRAAREDLAAALAESNLVPALKEALLSADRVALEQLVGAQANTFCGLYPVEEEEELPDDRQKDEPEPADDKPSARRGRRTIA